MYMYSGLSQDYWQWCATRGPSASWQQTFYLHSTAAGQAQTVDIVVDRNVASATGALWIAFEGTFTASAHYRHHIFFPPPKKNISPKKDRECN